MTLEKIRRKLRLLRRGLTTVVAIYRHNRNSHRLVRTLWFVATREGLIGLRLWLISNAPAATLMPATTPVTGLAATPKTQSSAATAELPYAAWLDRFNFLRDADVNAAQRHLQALDLPDLLILAVVRPVDLPAINRMVVSWLSQIHRRWRACIVTSPDFSPDDLHDLRAVTTNHSQISIVTTPTEITAAYVRADFTLLTFGTVLLNPLSAYMFLEAAARTNAFIVYSDHDRIQENGARNAPTFKPQFSPEYLARYNYVGDCLLLSRAIVLTPEDATLLPGLKVIDYDRLIARLILEAPNFNLHVEHIPFLLFHVLNECPREPHDLPLFANTGPTVAIIIPTRDGLAHLRACIDSVFEKTSYDLDIVELIIVDNNSAHAETIDYLAALATRPRVSILRYPHPFNFAAINNVAAAAAVSEILVFLNNDTVVQDPAWLSKLVAYASQPGVGIVGAKLLFPDGTIQHGGCVAGANRGTVQHLLSYALPDDTAAFDYTRELSLLTGACIAIRRDAFWQIGGFDPVLRVTWNDVKACLDCLDAGLRNIYIADPLLIHDESTTRAPDNTQEAYTRYFSEADYTRRRFRDYFYDDPSYNPNLSVDNAGDLAEPPRVRRPWFRQINRPTRILLLSVVYKIGFGVPVVIQQHARKLSQLGYEVVIGGPLAENEISFPGCERVILGSAQEAAVYAYNSDIALIVSHTPPFFEVPILIGRHIPVLAYDYGEPAAEFFPDPTRSYLLNVGYQKRAAAALTTSIATISRAVKDETLNKDALVVGLANSHLPPWSETLRPERDRMRAAQGWQSAFVVLTVCRFHENERVYKGLDKIAVLLREFPYLYPAQSQPVIWVLAGAGTPQDVEQVERLGFTVFPNVADKTLIDLYQAADAYLGFSKWEGYNLGISQALAMGLPTLGSDIPAHREFGIPTTNSILVASEWLADEVERRAAATPGQRIAKVYDWDCSTSAFVAVIEELLAQSAMQKPRGGASGGIWHDIPKCNASGLS